MKSLCEYLNSSSEPINEGYFRKKVLSRDANIVDFGMSTKGKPFAELKEGDMVYWIGDDDDEIGSSAIAKIEIDTDGTKTLELKDEDFDPIVVLPQEEEYSVFGTTEHGYTNYYSTSEEELSKLDR